MNTTLAEARELASDLKDSIDEIQGVEKVLCPPFISLASLAELLDGSTVKLGAQNLFHEEKGAFTGEVSPLMLKNLCEYVIIGHSERRQYFGETDEVVNRKLKAAMAAGLTPILCLGESLEERRTGRASQVIITQLRGALEGIGDPGDMVIAYEPVWAIGTGEAATPEQANTTMSVIRQEFGGLYGYKASEQLRIQYGGSVNPDNASSFICEEDIDGALVGGASLKALDFLSIVEQATLKKK
jgi:triosephosphate isomerase